MVEQMSKNTEKNEEEARDILLQAELDKFIENAIGSGQLMANNWMTTIMD